MKQGEVFEMIPQFRNEFADCSKSEEQKQICSNCRYFKFSDDYGFDGGEPSERWGGCHRFPPVYMGGMPDGEEEENRPYAWKWPEVWWNSFCGEFQRLSDRLAAQPKPEAAKKKRSPHNAEQVRAFLDSEEGKKAVQAAASEIYKNSRAILTGCDEEKDAFFEIFPAYEDDEDFEIEGFRFSLLDGVRASFEGVINWELREALALAIEEFDRLDAEREAAKKENKR